jgi:hypothetical protein
MSNLSVDYTGEWIPISGDVTEPQHAASSIVGGSIPRNLIDLSASNAFRDATLSFILKDATDHDQLLNTITGAIRNSAPETNALKVYTDYAAAIAYAIGKSNVALDVLKRSNPASVSPHIWAIVAAMKKQMPSAFYASLVMSSGETAITQWQVERSQYVTP